MCHTDCEILSDCFLLALVSKDLLYANVDVNVLATAFCE